MLRLPTAGTSAPATKRGGTGPGPPQAHALLGDTTTRGAVAGTRAGGALGEVVRRTGAGIFIPVPIGGVAVSGTLAVDGEAGHDGT